MGVEGKFSNVSMVLSAKDGRSSKSLARLVSLPVLSSSVELCREGDAVCTAPVVILEMLEVRCIDEFACVRHCNEGCFLNPGSLDDDGWF